LLSLTRPDVIEEVHTRYLAAGADVIETNTFTATAISQADYGTESLAAEMNTAAAAIARRAVLKAEGADPGRPRFVVGAIGPLNRTLSMSPVVNRQDFRAVTWDQVAAAYLEQARALTACGSRSWCRSPSRTHRGARFRARRSGRSMRASRTPGRSRSGSTAPSGEG